MYNRDITGKVNKDGITLGKVAELAVELSAPVAVGKVTASFEVPQTLEKLGAFPNFVVKQKKWDYFFGRGVTPDPHNTPRSLQNKLDLEKLGIFDNAEGQQKLLNLFDEGLTLSSKGKIHRSPYGITVTKHVKVSETGGLDIKYFYPNGVKTAKPQVSTIIPKIYQ